MLLLLFSHLVISESLQPHGLQHARLPCPSPSPGACSDSHPWSQRCHPPLVYSVIPFSSRLQSFPASGSFQMSQLFASGGHSIGASASTSVLLMNIQDWSPLGGLVGSPCSPSDSQESSPTPQFKSIIIWHSAFLMVQLSHPYMTTGRTMALIRWTLVGKGMFLLFNMLSRLVIAFLPGARVLISWLQSPSEVILEPPKNKVCWCFHCFPIYLPWSDGTACHDLSFFNVEF